VVGQTVTHVKTPADPAARMLDVAGRLFAAKRFHEVRMEDIAAAADVGKGTLYRYFKDKDALYLALLERAGVQLLERVAAARAAAAGPLAQLEALVAAVIDFFDEQPHVFDLIHRAEALGGLAAAWQPTRDAVVHQVHELFAAAAVAGDFTVADPETAAMFLLGGVRSVTRFGRRPRPDGLAGQLVHACLFGAAST
jgi:AcrR family transcriptional regulator